MARDSRAPTSGPIQSPFILANDFLFSYAARAPMIARRGILDLRGLYARVASPAIRLCSQ